MKSRTLLLFALVAPWMLVALAGSPLTAAATPGSPAKAAPGDPGPTAQLIVKFKDSARLNTLPASAQPALLARLSQVAGVELHYVRPMSGDAHVFGFPAARAWADAERSAKALAALPEVEYAEPDQVFTLDDYALNAGIRQVAAAEIAQATPNDTRYSEQWHYRYTAGSAEGMNLEPAWEITTGTASTVVAVLDTGILPHADLAGRTVAGYDMISDTFMGNDGDGRDANPSDPGDWSTANQCGTGSEAHDSSWHGTHVAGTIGAATNNSAGVAGVNWAAKIQAVRVLGRCGGTTSDIADGIRWAAGLSVSGVPANATPAKVLNMSLGGTGSCSATSQSAINAAVGAGAIIVVAAGNSNENASGHNPANCDNVITIASTGPTGDRAYYSNYGSIVEVAAPGGDISGGNSNGVLSTLNASTTGPGADSYAFYQGTSMATPHVAGLVSLIVALRPSYTQSQVLALLQSTVRAFPAGSTCTTAICGSGIVDAGRALAALDFTPTSFVYMPSLVRAAASSGGGGGTIINGTFEAAGGWTESSSSGFAVIGGPPSGVAAHGGTRVAWLTFQDSEVSYIQQQVSIPGGASTLSFWYYITSSEICGSLYDAANLTINGTQVWSKDVCTSASSSSWQAASVNIAAYAGQTVTVRFNATNDSTTPSRFVVDDVSMP